MSKSLLYRRAPATTEVVHTDCSVRPLGSGTHRARSAVVPRAKDPRTTRSPGRYLRVGARRDVVGTVPRTIGLRLQTRAAIDELIREYLGA